VPVPLPSTSGSCVLHKDRAQPCQEAARGALEHLCSRRISPPWEARARAETRACSVVIRANALHPLGETRASQPSGFIGARRRHVSSGTTGGPPRVAGRHWSAKDTQNGQYSIHIAMGPLKPPWQREVPRRVHRELCPTGPLVGFGLKGDPQRPSPMHRRTCHLSSQPSARVGHK
jgi:hypothetical protein